MICPQSDDFAFVRDDCKIINSPPGFNCMIWMSSGDTQYDSLVQCISRSRLVDIGERRALVVLLMDFLLTTQILKSFLQRRLITYYCLMSKLSLSDGRWVIQDIQTPRLARLVERCRMMNWKRCLHRQAGSTSRERWKRQRLGSRAC